jgi:hypothetical protein
MKQIFLDIDARLQTQVPEIRWIDFDQGQLDQETPPVSFPCALVSFIDSQVLQIGTGLEEENLSIQVRLGFKVRERTHSKANLSLRETALAHLDTVEKVRASLNGLSGTTYAPLQRVGTASEVRGDYRVYLITFSAVRTVGSNDPDPGSGDGGGGTGGGGGTTDPTNTYVPILDVDPSWPGNMGFESDIRIEYPPAQDTRPPFS